MKPDYHSEGHPSQGGTEVRAGGSFESAGSPGTKAAEPMAPASMASDEGYHDNAEYLAMCRKRGMPHSGHYPDNVHGSLSDNADNPTKGEGGPSWPVNYS